jgi:hypothetical protein
MDSKLMLEDIGAVGVQERIVALCSHRGELYVATEDRVYHLRMDPPMGAIWEVIDRYDRTVIS